MSRLTHAVLAVALGIGLAGVSSSAAEKPARHKGGQKAGHGARAEDHLQRLGAKVSARLARLQQRLQAHPNAPASVTAAADKLVGDLKKVEDDVGQAKAAVQARDKQQVHALKATLKSDRAAVHADRKAFRAAVHAAVKDLRDLVGHKGKQGRKRAAAKHGQAV